MYHFIVDADNFEPNEPAAAKKPAAALVDKWEGEDEEEDVKVAAFLSKCSVGGFRSIKQQNTPYNLAKYRFSPRCESKSLLSCHESFVFAFKVS